MEDKTLSAAVEAVGFACALSRGVRAALVTDDTLTKKDRSPVTIADLGVQAVISHHLHQHNPDIPLMAEEESALLRDPANAELRKRVLEHVARIAPALDETAVMAAIDRGHHQGGAAGRFWTMDPIDGTKGFIRNDQYAVALALIEDGVVQLGVLGCPSLPVETMQGGGTTGAIFAARRGGGARLCALDQSDARVIHVSKVTETAQAVICQSVETGHTSHGRSARIAAKLRVTAPSLHMDSQCKYGVVARGEASVYMRLPSRASVYEEMIWDHAAGCLIVEEAGGRVTDVNGKPLNFALGRTLRDNTGVIATNGHIHDQVIAAVRSVMAEA